MSVVSVNREFNLPLAALSSAAQRLLGALQDPTIGAPVVSHLSPTFVADFSAQLALVAKLSADHSGAVGSVGALVQSQATALADFRRLAGVARRAARLAFPRSNHGAPGRVSARGHDSTGPSRPPGKGRKLVAACQRSAPALAIQGWLPSSTDALAQALERLASFSHQREQVDDVKLGVTAERTAAANQLYRQCLMIQNVARLLYSALPRPGAPDFVEARSRFLLGEFPSPVSATAEPLPKVSVVSTPTPLVVPA